MSSWEDLTAVMLVSSAKSSVSTDSQTFGRSFIYMLNRRGPRIEPCGTPHCTRDQFEEILLPQPSAIDCSDRSEIRNAKHRELRIFLAYPKEFDNQLFRTPFSDQERNLKSGLDFY